MEHAGGSRQNACRVLRETGRSGSGWRRDQIAALHRITSMPYFVLSLNSAPLLVKCSWCTKILFYVVQQLPVHFVEERRPRSIGMRPEAYVYTKSRFWPRSYHESSPAQTSRYRGTHRDCTCVTFQRVPLLPHPNIRRRLQSVGISAFKLYRSSQL